MQHYKRIVFDFDDTIAFPVDRDWDNARPNKPLIEKINRLYDEGWRIDFYTARGSISCKTREEAKKKYLYGMVKWLENQGVKYHDISFDKPLATYYVDDKGITPEDFLKTNIRDLEGGFSGSNIYTDGKFVHKKDHRAHDVRRWYETVKGVNVPRVDRVVGDIITLEYIDHDETFFEDNFHLSLGLIQEALEALRDNPVPTKYEFEDYVEKIRGHVDNAHVPSFNVVLNGLENSVKGHLTPTFFHGDFGIKNMLFKGSETSLYLIDPIPDTFGCVDIDVAKFLASLLLNHYDEKLYKKSFDVLRTFNEIDVHVLRILISTEIIRVYKYHPDKNHVKSCVYKVWGW